MRIIGKTNTGFIIEASNNEIDSILAIGDERKGKAKEKIDVGTELSFTTALANLGVLKDISLTDSYRTLKQLTDAKVELESVIKKIDGLNAPLVAIQLIAKERRS